MMKGRIMKKIFLVLAMLMLAAPVLAGVTVTAARVGTAVPAVVQVSYAMDGGDANIPRAFALDVNMSPANATALNPTSTNTNFYVALGGTTVDGNNVTWGAQFVNKTGSGFTTEMASLWATNDPCGHTARPLSSGTLFQFTVDKTCVITLAENALRGGVDSNGVVMEDTTQTFPKSYAKLVGTTVTLDANCLYEGRVFDPNTGFAGLTVNAAMMTRWNNLGRPNCWCCNAQKRGNGVYTPAGSASKVDLSDAAALKNTANWNQNDTAANACLDFNFSGKIELGDAAVLKNTANWNQTVGAGPPCN